MAKFELKIWFFGNGGSRVWKSLDFWNVYIVVMMSPLPEVIRTLRWSRGSANSSIPRSRNLVNPLEREGEGLGHGFLLWLRRFGERILTLFSEQEADNLELPAPCGVDGQAALRRRIDPPSECRDPWWSPRLRGEWSCLPECWILSAGPCPLSPEGLDSSVLSSCCFLLLPIFVVSTYSSSDRLSNCYDCFYMGERGHRLLFF